VTEGRYVVDQPAALMVELRRLEAEARAQGRFRAYVLALRWIYEELRRTPGEFGESREWYPSAELQARCGFARPLYVGYGIHEPSRRVFL
jgi:hypothetical protein